MGNSFMRIDEVAEELGISNSYAYKIIKKLNADLNNMGYITIPGRVSREYFLEKFKYQNRKSNEIKDKER